ncbi:MAG: hypothetical protein U1A77_11940 [Pirellulales bacterium]
MQISNRDTVIPVAPGSQPNYDDDNPLHRLIAVFESLELAAEREHYAHDALQVLFPYETLELYGPSGNNSQVLDAKQQDFVDFQKQNIKSFTLGDTSITRGWVTVDDWTGPFLRISYRGGPDSRLSQAANHQLGPSIRLYLQVGKTSTSELLQVPYNEVSDRYEVELWSYPGNDLASRLDVVGKSALARGEILLRPDLVKGDADDFRREAVSDQPIPSVAPEHTLHPTNPLRIELAWANHDLTKWDSRNGQNYVYEFSMIVRGWDNFLKVGVSLNPHGGFGQLEYRNLLSNYFEFQGSSELGRTPAPWSFDAFGSKNHQGRREPFLAVDYMDLHIVRPNAGIGIHRHRDNQEIFMVLENEVLMIEGDWCEMPTRQRAFEIRTLRSGHFALLKPGQLHGLLNPTDENIPLLMFGGYD